MDSTGDIVTVSITGSTGTAVFRDAGNSPVADGDNIASVTISGASSDFQLTFGAQTGIVPNSIGPRNGFDSVYLGQITADTVIRGINTVTSAAIAPGGGPSTAVSGGISFVLTSVEGVNFSRGVGLFVAVVTGRDSDNLGILLTRGLIPEATIGGGGVASGGRFNVGYFWDDTLIYLNSNSYFLPTGIGKRTGEFWNGLFQPTGSLTTGRYVTVVPVAPSVG